MNTEVREAVEQIFDQLVEELSQLVAIPSVSSSSFDQNQVWESARFVAGLFESRGLETQILTSTAEDGTPGRPAVVAKTPLIEGAPTVLLYAHHDVQPPGDESRWTSPPFKAEIRDGRLYGRGSSDDGAGIIVHLGALSVLSKEEKLNVTVFIEGEEEVGSPSFTAFLREHHELLAADYIVVADSDNWQVGQPALTASLRGVCSLTVKLRVLEHALHSGMYGGPILDAVTLAARLISTFHNPDGSVAIAGLGGSEKADVQWDEADFRRDSSLLDGVQLAGRGDLASRMWTQPAVAIIGLDSTSVAHASNTIQPECSFTVSLRTVPGSDSNQAMQALRQHILDHVPFGAQVELCAGETGPSYQADLDSEAAQIAHQCLSEAWGVESVNIGVGGSIPFISDFQREFPGAQVIVTGVEDPATNAHSENESQHLGDLKNAVIAHALMLLRFAGSSK